MQGRLGFTRRRAALVGFAAVLALGAAGATSRSAHAGGQFSGSYNSAVVYNGQLHEFSYDATSGTLIHTWWSGSWQTEVLDGAGGIANGAQTGRDEGLYNSAIVYNGQLHDFYYDATNGDLRHVWWNGSSWTAEELDGNSGDVSGAMTATVGIWNSVLVYNGQLQDFYENLDGPSVRHIVWNGSSWFAETLDPRGGGSLSNSAIVYQNTVHDFYQSTAGLNHLWFANGSWHFETLNADPNLADEGNSSLVFNGQLQDFYTGSDGNADKGLYHIVWNGTRWVNEQLDFNNADWPSGIVYNNQVQAFYTNSASAMNMNHFVWTGTRWAWELLDGPGSTGGAGRTTNVVGSYNSAILYNSQVHDFYFDNTATVLRHAVYSGGWFFEAI